ncbi:phage virion morphogenesis protein [Vibrio injensis]|uniref:phage virion morphogenesis protein n=1 Tax=Vibrio injensis TaxID=1307414 RepID=UPI0009330543|nr:phage virion morphogenesis protein [Vibrio injensis]
MAGARVRVQYDDSQWQAALDALARAGADLSRPLNEVGEYLVSETLERFKVGKGPDGTAWKAVQRGGVPLVDRGHLRDSITYAQRPGEVMVGSGMVYAAIHHFGGKAGRGRRVSIDARPFLGVNSQDTAEIGQIFTDHLTEALQ